MTGQVLQEGRLDAIPVVDLVVATLRAPGCAALEMESDGVTRRFSFAEGKLLRIDSPSAADSLLRMLLKRKKLDEGALMSLREAASDEGSHIFQVLSDRDVLAAEVLSRECNLWAKLLLIQSVGWTDGSYRIETIDLPTTPGGVALDTAVPSAMLKGVYKRMDLDEIKGMLGPYGASCPVPVDALPFVPASLELDTQQLEFWDSIDGRRSVEEMLEFSGLNPDDTARMLFALHRLGMLSFEQAPDEGPARAPGSGARVLATQSGESGEEAVDLSAIQFKREGRRRPDSVTFHSVTPGSKESLASVGSGPVLVEVGVGHSAQIDEPPPPPPSEELAGLFDGMGLSSPPTASAPPPLYGTEELDNSPDEPPPPVASGDVPPPGAGPMIAQDDWLRLTTKDKERIRLLRSELNRMETANYFEFFSLTHEAPPMSVKKAYFQMAKLYHPDSLLDEPHPYRAMAEALFARFSEAWETLSDDEEKELYTRKKVFGEKDENDLAMEKVQKVLDAEASFKNGVRLLNAGKLQDALRHFKAAHENYDEEAEYLAYYAFVLFRTRRSNEGAARESLGMIKRAMEMNPNSAKLYHLAGKIHLLRNEPEQAKKFLRKTLKLQADNTEALRDYRRAETIGGDGRGGPPGKEGKKGFFSRFGRKKQEAPQEKSEEEQFIDSLDMDLDL